MWYTEKKHKNLGMVVYYSYADKQGLNSLSFVFLSVKSEYHQVMSASQGFKDEMVSCIWKLQRNVNWQNYQVFLNLIFNTENGEWSPRFFPTQILCYSRLLIRRANYNLRIQDSYLIIAMSTFYWGWQCWSLQRPYVFGVTAILLDFTKPLLLLPNVVYGTCKWKWSEALFWVRICNILFF